MKRSLILTIFIFSSTFIVGQEYIKVTKESVNIRFKPSSSSQIISAAKKGNVFEFYKEVGDWYAVFIFSGEDRYIHKSLCEKITYSFNLPDDEQQRKKVFKELLSAEDRATNEADRKYPNDVMKNIDQQRVLDDRYKLLVINKYNLQPPIYDELKLEGVQKRWF